MLERKVVSKQKGEHLGYGWCGGLCRWGTAEKTRAIKKFKQSLGVETIDYVGIAADETQRFEKERSDARRLPLVDWGITEADCLQYCYAHGFRWMEKSPKADGGQIDLYEILDRVSCWCCTNKNLKELRNIYIYLPQYWERLKELQMKIDRPYDKARNAFNSGNISGFEDWQIGNIGFIASYNGRWFDGGYAKSGYEKTKNGVRYRDYYKEASANLLAQAPNLRGITFKACDYKSAHPKGFVVYCDPPYCGTKQYANAQMFDYNEFWNIMREGTVKENAQI